MSSWSASSQQIKLSVNWRTRGVHEVRFSQETVRSAENRLEFEEKVCLFLFYKKNVHFLFFLFSETLWALWKSSHCHWKWRRQLLQLQSKIQRKNRRKTRKKRRTPVKWAINRCWISRHCRRFWWELIGRLDKCRWDFWDFFEKKNLI